MTNEIAASQKISAWSWLATWLILVLGAILVSTLLFVSYSACFFLVLGVLLAWAARRLLRLTANRRGIRFMIIGALLALLTCFSSYFMLLPTRPQPPLALLVEEYEITIEPVKPNLSEFQVWEEAILSASFPEEKTWSVSPAVRQIKGRNRGFVLKEFSIAPLENAPLGGAVLRTDECRSSNVELRDFPIGSFYAARDAENLIRYPYVDTETITWSIRNLGRGIVFSYVPPPLRHFRPILAPFMGATSLSEWLIGLLGFIVAVAVIPIIRPVLLDIARKKLKSWVEGHLENGGGEQQP